MKIQIDDEEWFPVYEINKRGHEIDLTDEEYEKISKCFKEFKEHQSFLREKFKEAQDKFYERG